MMRVVSMVASATEIVCALGAGEMLVGRSHECDSPAWVRRLPAMSEPAFDVSVSSGEIDREVNRRMRAGEPLYHVHGERILALRPDVIISQGHCAVCAVTPGDVTRSRGCTHEAQQLSITALSLEDIFGSMVQIATRLGLEKRGRVLVAEERARLERVRERVAGRRRPTVAMLEWTDPVFAMGNWGPELVEAAGGALLLGHKGEYSRAIRAEELREADPEYIIVAPCGYRLERAAADLPVLERHAWWRELRAVREDKVAVADGNLFFNRSGMTVRATAEIVAEMLHGEVFGAKTEGVHWRWVNEGLGEPAAAFVEARV